MRSALDITGRRFGRLVASHRTGSNRQGLAVWECACDCGRVVRAVASEVSRGKKLSCGCLARDTASTSARARTSSLTLDNYFSANTTRVESTGCIEWTGARDHDGYGVAWVGGRKLRAHRVALAAVLGQIDPSLMVCHRCDNPPCVNVEHLFTGTCKDNLQDAARKGRMAAGERNGRAKLSAEKVAEIRASDEPSPRIAARLGVSKTTILRIRSGECWRAC